MNRPRTPEHYPRMKVRGERRRRIAPLQRIRGRYTEISLAAKRTATSFDALAAILSSPATRAEVQASLHAAYYDGYGLRRGTRG